MLGFLLPLILVAKIIEAQSQCYNVAGKTMDQIYEPCNPNATFSSCCQLNHSSGFPDICLGSGLCLSTRDDYAGTIWGNGCTDRNGRNAACPQICAGIIQNSDFWSLLQCPEQLKWCCRAWGDWTSCCNSTDRTVMLSSHDTTPLQVPNASAFTNTSTLTRNESLTGSKSVVIGVLGGVLGGASLTSLAAALLLWKQNRRLKSQKLKDPTTQSDRVEVPSYEARHTIKQDQSVLVYPSHIPVEADNTTRSELDTPSQL